MAARHRTGIVRAGIVGAGFIGEVHARAVRAVGGVVAAVAASTAQRSAAAADRLGAQRAAASAEELVVAEDVDVVHICTPNHLHARLTELALAEGKHVVCEKPLATDVGEAQRMLSAATQAGIVAAVPFVYRYYATVREARARVQRGATGPLHLLHGTYLQDWLSTTDDTNWRVDPAMGGASRAFADIGVHWCDLVEFTTGHRITKLTARTLAAHPRRVGGQLAPAATEDAATVLFETDQGAIGSLVVSQVSPGRKNRLWFSLDGAAASLSFDQELPDSLWVVPASTTLWCLGAARRSRPLPSATASCRPAIRRDTRTASTPSWARSTPRSPANSPTACPRSPMVFAQR
jgi:predicted dehydrogenase